MNKENLDNVISTAVKKVVDVRFKRNPSAIREVYGDKVAFYQYCNAVFVPKIASRINLDFEEKQVLSFVLTHLNNEINVELKDYYKGTEINGASIILVADPVELRDVRDAEPSYFDAGFSDVDATADYKTLVATIDEKLQQYNANKSTADKTDWVKVWFCLTTCGFNYATTAQRFGGSRQLWQQRAQKIGFICKDVPAVKQLIAID